MALIYRVTNLVNQKIYIGFTRHSLSKRKMEHKCRYKSNNSSKLYKAIRKYGWDAFSWEEVYISDDDEHCLMTVEPLIIKNYDAVYNGYNTCPGGRGLVSLIGDKNGMFGRTHTESARKAISQKNKGNGKNLSYEQRYGIEKAKILKEIRRKAGRAKNNTGVNNSRYDSTIYTFIHAELGIYRGTRLDFYSEHDVSRSGVCDLIKGRGVSHRGWRVIV